MNPEIQDWENEGGSLAVSPTLYHQIHAMLRPVIQAFTELSRTLEPVIRAIGESMKQIKSENPEWVEVLLGRPAHRAQKVGLIEKTGGR